MKIIIPPQNNDTNSQNDTPNRLSLQGSGTILTISFNYEADFDFNISEQVCYAGAYLSMKI